MDAALDTLATAFCVKVVDLLAGSPQHAPWRPEVGIKPQFSDPELVALSVMQALLSLPARPVGCGSPALI